MARTVNEVVCPTVTVWFAGSAVIDGREACTIEFVDPVQPTRPAAINAKHGPTTKTRKNIRVSPCEQTPYNSEVRSCNLRPAPNSTSERCSSQRSCLPGWRNSPAALPQLARRLRGKNTSVFLAAHSDHLRELHPTWACLEPQGAKSPPPRETFVLMGLHDLC